MKDEEEIANSLEEEAADWVLKLSEGLLPEEEKEFQQWLDSDPAAQASLDNLKSVWERYDILDPRHFELGEEVRASVEKVGDQAGASRAWWRSFTLKAAAAVAVTALLGVLATVFTSPADGVSAQRLFDYASADFYELEDGSSVDLNEGASVVCKYSPERREFWVKSGEAYFTVAKDPERPFEVYVGETKVKALGTQFNVKYFEDSVEVLVTEGVVSLARLEAKPSVGEIQAIDVNLAPAKLSMNQKALVRNDAPARTGFVIERVEQEAVSKLLDWKPVNLEFDSTPLSEVAEAFNRYNEKQIVIADSRIGTLEIVATFRSNKLEAFINLLQTTSDVVAEKDGNQIVLSSRN